MELTTFKPIDWYVDDPLEIIQAPDEMITQLKIRGVGISAYTKEGCMGCGGLLLWEDDLAEAWIRVSRKGFKHRKEGIRAIKKAFHIVTNTVKDMCIFCWVDTEWPEAQRMVKWLGFIPGTETREMNNRTYLMWDYNNGNDFNDCRSGHVCDGADTAR
jgi:hypothetical protein